MVIATDTEKLEAQGLVLQKKSGEVIHYIATNLMEKYKFKSLDTNNKNNPIFIYGNGIYTEEGRKVIKEETEMLLQNCCRSHIVQEVISKIERSTYIDKAALENTPVELICIENGIFDLQKQTLIPHNPEIVFTSKIPIVYDNDAGCPIFKSFIEDVLYEDDIKIVQEWFGYNLWKVYNEKKALVCIGPTNTGKTVFMNILINFLGKDNICSIDLHDLTDDIYSSERLYGKYANVNDELTSVNLKDVSKFKKLTGRSVLSANPKFKERFDFENFAKLTFATNKMPCLKGAIEDPQSYFGRWIIVFFDNLKDESEQDKSLTDKINTPEEMSGIFNWALKGLKRLKLNEKFSYDKTWQETERVLKASGEGVYSFEASCIEQCDGNLVSKDDMFKAYCDYCSLNDKMPERSKEAFGKKFKPSYVVNKNNGPEEYKGWLNVKVKEVLPVMGV